MPVKRKASLLAQKGIRPHQRGECPYAHVAGKCPDRVFEASLQKTAGGFKRSDPGDFRSGFSSVPLSFFGSGHDKKKAERVGFVSLKQENRTAKDGAR